MFSVALATRFIQHFKREVQHESQAHSQRLGHKTRQSRQGVCYLADTPKGVLLAQKLLNPSVIADDFLSVVLIHVEDGRYVVWTHNAEYNGYSGGEYFTNVDKAMQFFNGRS